VKRVRFASRRKLNETPSRLQVHTHTQRFLSLCRGTYLEVANVPRGAVLAANRLGHGAVFPLDSAHVQVQPNERTGYLFHSEPKGFHSEEERKYLGEKIANFLF